MTAPLQTRLERRTHRPIVVVTTVTVESEQPEHAIVTLARDGRVLERRPVETRRGSDGGAVATIAIALVDEGKDVQPGELAVYTVEIAGAASFQSGQVQASETSLSADALSRFMPRARAQELPQ